MNPQTKPRFGIIFLLVLAALAAGCRTAPILAASNTSTPTAFQPPSTSTPTSSPQAPTGTATSTSTATPAAAQVPLTQYQLDVQFDYTNHRVAVNEIITITNRWSDPLPTLVLDVEANPYSGVFVLNALALNGSPLSSADYALKGNRLEIPLANALMPGGITTLSVDYELSLPAIPDPSPVLRPDPFGFTARQTNLVNWYPYLAAYDPGSGWLMHEPYSFGEHEVYDAADYSVTLELLDPPSGLVIAASALDDASQAQNGFLHYSLPRARTFAFSASTAYVVSTRLVGSITLNSYSFPWDAATGEDALDATARALAIYSDLFGPYDRPSLNVVEADFLDGMEYDGLYFLSNGFYNIYDGTPSSYLTAIAVHETAHQWWYGKVGSDQALEPWLDEALATYSEKIYYENAAPLSMNWWQDARIDYPGPQGVIDLPVREYHTYERYRNAVYLNGAHFFQDLRDLVGDDAFFAFLKDYAEKYAYQRTTSRDFFTLLAEHTPADLSPLFSKYFSSPVSP